jgi:hypothetical protein
MGEDVTDQALLDVRELGMGESLGDSALKRVLELILATSAQGASNSFQANI